MRLRGDSEFIFNLFIEKGFALASYDGIIYRLSVCAVFQMLHHLDDLTNFHVVEFNANISFGFKLFEDRYLFMQIPIGLLYGDQLHFKLVSHLLNLCIYQFSDILVYQSRWLEVFHVDKFITFHFDMIA